jgi:hypothetical protein
MPYFTPRVLDAVEAYRLPQGDQRPTDGLIFFLRELNILSLMGDKRSGDWIVNADNGPLVMTDEEFQTTYKPLED